MIHAVCWAHARRKYIDAAKLNREDAAAIGIVALINELFTIDALDPRSQRSFR
jgi:hypothetical protein